MRSAKTLCSPVELNLTGRPLSKKDLSLHEGGGLMNVLNRCGVSGLVIRLLSGRRSVPQKTKVLREQGFSTTRAANE